MTPADEGPRKILIGVVPTGTDVHLFGEDITVAARMLDDANRRADLARAEEERARKAKLAAEAKAAAMRSAGNQRRLRKAMTAMFGFRGKRR